MELWTNTLHNFLLHKKKATTSKGVLQHKKAETMKIELKKGESAIVETPHSIFYLKIWVTTKGDFRYETHGKALQEVKE